MTESEALQRMVAPGTPRVGKWRQGVIQVLVTSRCDKSCFSCTQASNVAREARTDMGVDQFAQAVESLRGYFGVVGVFGGNPAMHPHFVEICRVLRDSWVPFEQRGLWSNNPLTPEKARAMAETFNPAVSNLNCHLDRKAFEMFKQHWPGSMPFGLDRDSRHSPPWVAMKDLGIPEEKRWDLISRCDINQHWSAGLGVFRGQLRAWFCEVAMAQSILHQDEPDYPDTGKPIPWVVGNGLMWWEQPMELFANQVRKHCHECGVPLRGYGQLAQDTNPATAEQTTATHAAVYNPKDKRRPLHIVTDLASVRPDGLPDTLVTHYLQNAVR